MTQSDRWCVAGGGVSKQRRPYHHFVAARGTIRGAFFLKQP
jgi:hypothetical protein